MARSLAKTRATAPPSSPPSSPLITDAKLKELYSSLLRFRRMARPLDESRKQSALRRKPSRLKDHEAVFVGVTAGLRRSDWIAPPSSDSPPAALHDVPLASRWAGRVSAVTTPAARRSLQSQRHPLLHCIPSSLHDASDCKMAVGVALACKAQARGNLVVAFASNAVTKSAAWRNALLLASEHELPLLFVVANKLTAKQTPPPRRKKAGTLEIRAQECGVPVIPVDLSDVVAIYRVSFESIHKARHGGGPTLIEGTRFLTTALKGRKAADSAEKQDPLLVMETYLKTKGLFSEVWKKTVIAKLDREIESAIRVGRVSRSAKGVR